TANLGHDPDGDPTAVSYQWLRDGQAINGATGSTYTLTSGDASHQISVKAVYTDGQGFHDTSTSNSTAAVQSGNHAPVFGAGTVIGSVTEDAGSVGSNLVKNPGFESSQTKATNWTTGGSGDGDVYGNPHSGSGSYAIGYTSSSGTGTLS